ncbi:hypothetical protein ABK040_004087 [Willaertia magna]
MSLNQLPDELLLEIIYFLIGKDNTTTNPQNYYGSSIPSIENVLSFQTLFHIVKNQQLVNNSKENFNSLLNNYLINQYNYFTKVLYFLLTNPLLKTQFVGGDVLAYEAFQMMELQKLIFKKERGLFIKDRETINPNRPSWRANEPYNMMKMNFVQKINWKELKRNL